MSDTVVYVIIGVIGLVFGVAALKGYAWKSFVGLLILVFLGPILSRIPIVGLLLLVPIGLAIFRALAVAKPESVWAKIFYDDEKLARAEREHSKESGGPEADSHETSEKTELGPGAGLVDLPEASASDPDSTGGVRGPTS